MTLKNAALLALIGTILATVFLTWTFIMTALNVLRGLAPPLMLFPWFVYGIVHDQFTARICIEYFTVFHPQHYEDNMVMSLFVTLFTAVCVLIGVVLLLVGLVRHRRSNPAPVAPVSP